MARALDSSAGFFSNARDMHDTAFSLDDITTDRH